MINFYFLWHLNDNRTVKIMIDTKIQADTEQKLWDTCPIRTELTPVLSIHTENRPVNKSIILLELLNNSTYYIARLLWYK